MLAMAAASLIIGMGAEVVRKHKKYGTVMTAVPFLPVSGSAG